MHLMWGTVGQGAFFVSHRLVLRALGSQRERRATRECLVIKTVLPGMTQQQKGKYSSRKENIKQYRRSIAGVPPSRCLQPRRPRRGAHRTLTVENRAHTARHIAYRSVIHRTAVLILPVRCVQPQLRQGRDEPRRVRPPDEWVVDGGGAVRGPKKAVDEGGYREADR